MRNNYLKNKTLGLFVKTKGVLSKPFFSGLGHILCFHRIINPDGRRRIWASSGKEISEEKLLFIINFFIRKGYEFISMDELFNRLSLGKKQRKFIVVTFDDGYIDNYTIAFPLFKKLGIPFIIYVSTGMPDGEMTLWPYFLEEYILNTDLIKFQVNETVYEFPSCTQHEKEIAYNNIRSIVLQDERLTVPHLMNNVFEINKDKSADYTKEQALSWAQLRELCTCDLITIGAHGKNHFALSKQNDRISSEEITESKIRLEQQLEKRINHFAYPYGTKNEFELREENIVFSAGYKTSVTLLQGNVFPLHRTHPYRLPRIPMSENVNEEILNNITNGIRQFSFNGFQKTQ